MRFPGILSFCTATASIVIQALANQNPPSPFSKDPSQCDCFLVSGQDPGYFQHYKLWDFRSVPLTRNAGSTSSDWMDDDWWDDVDDVDDEDDSLPEDVEDQDDTQNDGQDPHPDSVLFFETSFEKDWSSQKWQRHRTALSPVSMVNSKQNVFLTRDRERGNSSTYLVLRTTRRANYTSTAEIETRLRNIYHCSIRVRLRLLPSNMTVPQPAQPKEWPPRDPRQHAILDLNNGGVPRIAKRPPSGACAGIFTYGSWDCESDIEILTSDPLHRVHYANQPDYDPASDTMIPGASSTVDLPVPWTEWSTHRLDWFPNMSRWYVNNQAQDAKEYRVPNLQSRLVINLWSDGGVWTGDMKLGDSIFMGIEWIELAYNVSDHPSSLSTPPSPRVGGHQLFPADTTAHNENNSSDLPPDPDSLKKKKKHRKCRKGRKGRKCRKRQKHRKPKQGHGGPCRRPCVIDDFHSDLSG